MYVSYLLFRKDAPSNNLWQDEQGNQPPPRQKLQIDIVPNRNKRENHPNIIHRIPRPAQWHIDIANNPQIITLVPTPPESQGRIIVGHTADHVLGSLDTVKESPKTEEAPDDEEFEPDEDQIEKDNHGDLQDGVVVPGLRLADCHHVHVVVDKFHGQQGEDEPTGPHQQCLCWNRLWVPQLSLLNKTKIRYCQ
jgi:hypothetical protein